MSVGYQHRFLQTSRQFFNGQKVEVLAALDKLVGKGVTKAVDPLFNMDDAIKELAQFFQPIYSDQINDAGREALLLIDMTGFEGDTAAIVQFIKRRSTKVSKAVNQETDKQLRAELAEGLAAGETIEELRARIEQVYGAAAGFRSERIARTETIRASNFASIEAWEQSGLVEKKEWYTARDERVCEFCGPLDGRIIDLKGTYFEQGSEYAGSNGGTLKLDFESIESPPLHANCRCTLLPVLSD